MIHSFDIDDAVSYGILESVLLYNIRFWVAKNEANNRHSYMGKHWTYNSAKAFCHLFPYVSQQQIQRALKRLEEQGAIEVGNFNTNPYDHTKWYTLTDSSNLINRKVESDQPSNTDRKPNTTVDQKNSTFEVFWKAYPRKTNKGFAKKVFEKLKPSDELLKKMLSALEQQTPLWKDPQYIPHPSTWLNGERWEDEVQKPMNANELAYEKLMGRA